MLSKHILMASQQEAPSELAEAIDFDGTNDYLSRSSELVGNADGKTFTFSCWLYGGVSSGTQYIYQSGTGSGGFLVYSNASLLIFVGYNAAGTVILQASIPLTRLSEYSTFYHVLCSVDLSNTGSRGIYVNDVLQTTTWTTYTNDSINFTNTQHQICRLDTTIGAAGRLSNLFLDHTYRDLSVEANRRLFITADRKPAANQQTLNPILYLPLNDPAQPGLNLGTGGDFTLTGVVARSGRGPNQFNAPYSDLDGTADYLRRTTAPVGIADSKAFTVSFVMTVNAGGSHTVINMQSTTAGFRFYVYSNNGADKISFVAKNASNITILNAVVEKVLIPYRNYVVTLSVDLSSTSTRNVYINGEIVPTTWSTFTDGLINFNITSSALYQVGAQNATPSSFHIGNIGGMFFDTKYIDLSQPDNLAKFVTGTGIDAKPVDLGANGEIPFGTPPLIYLPMYGNNAGKNYGTGGDFTVNSGPFTGARGANEFWGNKADFDGTTGYLARTSALTGVSDGKTFSCAFTINIASSGTNRYIANIAATGVNTRWSVSRHSSGALDILARSVAGAILLKGTTVSTSFTTGRHDIQICIDLTDSNKCVFYVNNVVQSMTWTTYTNDNMQLSGNLIDIGCYNNGTSRSNFWDGELSEFYFTTDYIDFSQEANRLKFRDAFGNPVNLTPQIEAGTIPNPAIYMRFDPANFGKNSGTGGDFTAYGTITDGGQL